MTVQQEYVRMLTVRCPVKQLFESSRVVLDVVAQCHVLETKHTPRRALIDFPRHTGLNRTLFRKSI